MSYIISYYDPTSNLLDAALASQSQENTTGISGTTDVPIGECANDVNIMGVCIPRWVFGMVALIFLAIILLNVLKVVVKLAI